MVLALLPLILQSLAGSIVSSWVSGFDTISPKNLLGGGVGPGGLGKMAAIVNIPQLALSAGYLLLNRVVSAMATSREWSNYAHHRKGLRVTKPEGQQRSTYWLQLPYVFAIPLMIISGVLHYLISGSFFLVDIVIWAPTGERTAGEISTISYSAKPSFLAALLTMIIIAITIGLGFISNDPAMPPAWSCSAAISAACHQPLEDTDAARERVLWGQVPSANGSSSETSVGHCSFGSVNLHLPTIGKLYS